MDQLPSKAPEGINYDVGGPELLPIAVFTLVDVPESDLQDLTTRLEGDQAIDVNDSVLHLLELAPQDGRKQTGLNATLNYHIESCRKYQDEPPYFPFAFVAIHSMDWDAEGVYVVYIDPEEPHTITSFRTSIADAADACQTLHDDEDGVEQVKENYGMK